MKTLVKTIFITSFTIFLFNISILACTCSYKDIKTNGFSGQIFSIAFGKDTPNFNSPLPKAALKLLQRIDDKDKVVAELNTNDLGEFVYEKIKPGTYFLKVEHPPNFDSVWVRIKISVLSHRKKDKIIIALAPGLSCCGGYIKVQKTT